MEIWPLHYISGTLSCSINKKIMRPEKTKLQGLSYAINNKIPWKLWRGTLTLTYSQETRKYLSYEFAPGIIIYSVFIFSSSLALYSLHTHSLTFYCFSEPRCVGRVSSHSPWCWNNSKNEVSGVVIRSVQFVRPWIVWLFV